MSLVAQALCITVQNMLNGRTWAGTDILLQPVDPIAELMKSDRQPAPVIAVYAEKSIFDVEGRATQGINSEIELKVFVYNAPGVQRRQIAQDDEIIELHIDTRGAGIALNAVARQVDLALRAADPLWSGVWKKFAQSVSRREVRYVLVELENAVRIPTAEISYSVKSIPDPDDTLTAAWLLFESALNATAEGALIAKLFRSLIERPADIPDWKAFRDNFGLSDAGMQAIGLGPYQGVTLPNGEIPVLTEHTVTAVGGDIDE